MRRIDEFHRLLAVETDACVEWPHGKSSKGYGLVRFGGKSRPTHRLALILVTGVEPAGLDAAHGPCHNTACMNARHLSWKTRAENVADMKRDGTRPDRRGQRGPGAKLNDDAVREIRRSPEPTAVLAEKYSVSRVSINNVRRRATWSHV